MHATWNFVKTHRGKIFTGTAIVASLYSAKKFLETDTATACITNVKEILFGCGEESADEEIEQCIAETRRHFLFDVHQQSCDKTLRKILPELTLRIAERFNTEQLLDELRSLPVPSPERKIQIWEHLKTRSLCRLISLIIVFPLTILILKSQKAIICQQLCQLLSNKKTKKDERSSIFSQGISFLNSLLQSDQNGGAVQQPRDSTGKLTELFNNVTVYFREDGIALLMGLIERVVCQSVEKVPLSGRFNSNDFLFLIEKIRAKMEEICGTNNNYVDFIVPNSEVHLANFGVVENAHLSVLIQHLIDVIRSRNARHLVKEFGDKYLEEVMKFLDEAMAASNESLPLAKIVPVLCDAFAKIGTVSFGSTFHSLLSSTELHRFTLFVSECSKREDFNLMREKKRLLKFAEYLGHCSREATDYGKCVATNAERIRKGDCSTEFDRLIACLKKRQVRL
ncbi:hypothetical protein niasHT_010012 [Heterodera trifolii]|uniref:Peroxisomal biogenesis factor 3 n=1 Tax=Heterodera trifolii TaxID=157864 RepID=A0ABD2M8J2_9BILA